jgi:hypothetical protein
MKYLFEANFKDGEIYVQHPEDLPKEGTSGSSFAFVKQKIDEVTAFYLLPQSGCSEEYCTGINLENGIFLINGLPVKIDEKDFPLGFPPDIQRRLIYFRRVTVNYIGTVEQNKSTEFCIGWQATVNGKNYQQIISIS